MNKEKKVTIKLDVRSAVAVLQVLFKEQQGYSLKYTPERIIDIRAAMQQLTDQINDAKVII